MLTPSFSFAYFTACINVAIAVIRAANTDKIFTMYSALSSFVRDN